MFAGHSHGPTPYLIPDCPLCEAAKEARNQAIGHLKDALLLTSTFRPDGDDRPTLRLNLGPIGITGDDIGRCHSIDLTAKQAEALSDAIDSMNAYASSQPTDSDQQLMDRMTAAAEGRIAGWEREEYPGGLFSAAAVAQNDTDLWDEVNDVYADLDARTFLNDVMDSVDPEGAAAAYEQLITGEWDGEL